MKVLKTIKKLKPLYISSEYNYCSDLNSIFLMSKDNENKSLLLKLPVSWFLVLLCKLIPILKRILRLSIDRLHVNNGVIYISFNGKIYVVNHEGVILNNFTLSNEARGFSMASSSQITVIGEYARNKNRRSVDIIGTRDNGITWKKVYTFEPGVIRHVHEIIFDSIGNKFWIATGDEEGECLILSADKEFENVKTEKIGGQENRFFTLQTNKNWIITAMDSPQVKNKLVKIDKNNFNSEFIGELNASCFYSVLLNSFYFTTVAEYSDVNDINNCKLYRYNDEIVEIKNFEVDFMSKLQNKVNFLRGKFGWPQIYIPEYESNSEELLHLYFTGTKKYSDCYVVMKE